MRATAGAALAATALLLLPAAARADVLIDSATERGDFSIATAAGNVKRPATVTLTVRASPSSAAVAGDFVLFCQRGSRTADDRGSFSGTGTVTRRLALPMRRPGVCTVTTSARLAGKGDRLTVTLRATQRGA